jgi:hypothetical protein
MSDEPREPEKAGEPAGSRKKDELRSYVDDYMTNWREFDGPLWEKFGLTIRNRAKSYTIGMGCCGHPGQPGC